MPTIPLVRGDVIHLHSQFSAATKKKLDLYLPNADPHDALKQRVRSHVDEFVLELFGALDGNIVVDGTETGNGTSISVKEILTGVGGSQGVETEPFDFSLAEEVRKMWVQVEQETVKLTELRKKAPVELKRKYVESFEEMLKDALDEGNDVEEEEEDTPHKKIKRLDDIQITYKEAVDTVSKLKDDIPGQRNELVKIEKVANFLSEKS